MVHGVTVRAAAAFARLTGTEGCTGTPELSPIQTQTRVAELRHNEQTQAQTLGSSGGAASSPRGGERTVKRANSGSVGRVSRKHRGVMRPPVGSRFTDSVLMKERKGGSQPSAVDMTESVSLGVSRKMARPQAESLSDSEADFLEGSWVPHVDALDEDLVAEFGATARDAIKRMSSGSVSGPVDAPRRDRSESSSGASVDAPRRDRSTGPIDVMDEVFLDFRYQEVRDQVMIELQARDLNLSGDRAEKMMDYAASLNENRVFYSNFETFFLRAIDLVKRENSVFEFIEDWDNFCIGTKELYDEVAEERGGKSFPRISELNDRQDFWEVAVETIAGHRWTSGPAQTERDFPMEKLSQVLMYLFACHKVSDEVVHSFVGREPSGKVWM
jgi:hypothetical protein